MLDRIKTSPPAIDSATFSLSPDLIQRILKRAKPLGHHSRPGNDNLGFGFLYYGLVRAVRPRHILVIGSGHGFSVVCLALGLKDNGKGQLSFIDPSYSLLKNGPFHTVGGQSKWDHPQKVKDHFARFGLEGWVTHYKLRSDQFFSDYSRRQLPPVDLAFIDGNHAYPPSATISCKPPGGREKTATSSFMTPTSTCEKCWGMPGSNVSSRN